MSRRERQRRKRRNKGGPHRIIFLALGLVFTGVVIAGIVAVAWVINVANSAPSLETKKPIELGATSRIYAADGTRLGFINANILRTPVTSNAIAGMVLAITQPLRIGDLVTFEGETGTVEDVTLTYTWLRTGADARLIIPNERLAAGMLRNDSIRSPVIALEASVWLAPDVDETAALAAVEALEDYRSARIAEVTDAGIRLQVAGPPVAPQERIEREGQLRAAALRALRQAGCRGHRGEP